MRFVSYALSLIVAIFGTVLVLVGWGKGDDEVLKVGGPLVVAGLVLFGTTLGLQTWREERRKGIEQKQRDTYGSLVSQLVARFASTGSYDPAVEAQLRSDVATWADVRVVRKLQAWNDIYDRHVPNMPPGTVVALTAAAKEAFEVATAEVAFEVRKQLPGTASATVIELRGALFNTPGPLGETRG